MGVRASVCYIDVITASGYASGFASGMHLVCMGYESGMHGGTHQDITLSVKVGEELFLARPYHPTNNNLQLSLA